VANFKEDELGDVSSLADPSVIPALVKFRDLAMAEVKADAAS
jgi:hypothetical protein